MKCKKCNKNNVRQALFCHYCGNKFTKEEIDNAKEKGIVANLLKIKDWYDTLTLSKITGSIYYKIASILIVLFLGLYLTQKNGDSLKLMESNEYVYTYNTKAKEYYIFTTNKEVNLSLYLPKKVDKLYLKSFDKEDKKIDSKVIETVEELKVEVSNNKVLYYKVSIYEKENNKNTIKFYVLDKE